MAALSLRDTLRRHARPYTVLSREETGEALKLAEGLKLHLEEQAAALIQRCGEQPLVVSYSSDGTPLLLQNVTTSRLPSGAVLRRAGKRRVEFLLQRGVLVSKDINGVAEAAHVLQDPIAMSDGKKAPHLFKAYTQFMPNPRTLGASGIVIFHYSFDRAMFEPLMRMVTGRHSLQYDPAFNDDIDDNAGLLQLSDWIVGTACAMHDTHNALKWSVGEFSTAQLLKDFNVTTQSLRNGFGELADSLPDFLLKHVAFVPRTDSEDDCRVFWLLLGIDATWLDTFVQLDMRWQPDTGVLAVNTAADGPEVMAELTSAFFYLLRSETFVEGRFLGVGRVCRVTMAGIACGFSELVRFTLGGEGTDGQYLNGYQSKLSEDIRLFEAVTRSCSWVGPLVF